jgi:hypothetical protein
MMLKWVVLIYFYFLSPYPNSIPQFYNSLDRNELWDYRFGLGAVKKNYIVYNIIFLMIKIKFLFCHQKEKIKF